MTKKIAFILCSYMLLAISLSVLNSCRDLLKYDARICDIEFFGTEVYPYEIFDLSDSIGFNILGKDYCESAYIPKVDLISNCYATTKCAEWHNNFDTESYELFFDRPISFKNTVISQNTNIFENIEIRKNIIIEKFTDCKLIWSTIGFTPELKEDLHFEDGIYNVKFKCKTTDGLELEKSINAKFNK